jgi:hypothetical protein
MDVGCVGSFGFSGDIYRLMFEVSIETNRPVMKGTVGTGTGRVRKKSVASLSVDM